MITEENCDSAQQMPVTTEGAIAAQPQAQPEPGQTHEPPTTAHTDNTEECEKDKTDETETNEESLRAELEEKTLLLNRNENKIREQQAEIQQLRNDITQQQQQQQQKEDENEDNEGDIHMEVIHLREKRDLFFEEREALEKDNASMRSEIDNYLTKEVSQYATERKRLNDSRKTLETQLTKTSTNCKVLDFKYTQARARKKELEKRVSTLTTENTKLSEENRTLTINCERSLREYNAKTNLFTQNYRVLEGQLNAERNSNATLREYIVKSDATTNELRKEIAQQQVILAHERENFEKLTVRYKDLSQSYEKHLSESQERAAADALTLRKLECELQNVQKSEHKQKAAPSSSNQLSINTNRILNTKDFTACKGLMTDVELDRVKGKLMELASSSGSGDGNAALRANELCSALQNLNSRYNNLAKTLESEFVRSNMLERELAECKTECARMSEDHTELERLREEREDMEKTCAEQREEINRLKAENSDLTRRAVSSEFKCKALDRELAQALLSKSYTADDTNSGDDKCANGIVPKNFIKFDSVVDLQNKYNDLLFQLNTIKKEATVAERRRMSAENERLNKELSAAKAQYAALKEEATAGKRERESLIALLKRNETVKESGNIFLDASQRFSAAFKRHREEARRTEERLETEVQSLSELLLQSQKECAALNVSLSSESARNEALKAENERVRKTNIDYVKQIGRDEAELNKRDKELSEVRVNLENTQRALRDAKSEVSEHRRNVQRLEATGAALVTANETLEKEKETLSAAVAELTALRDACDNTQDDLNELQRKHIQESAAQVAALKEALARKTTEANTMEAALRIQIEEVRQRLVTAEARCAETRGELAIARGDESALRVELRAERDQRDLLNKKIADVNAEHRITLYDREHSLAEKVRAHEARNAELAEELRVERERTAALSEANERAAADKRASAATIDKISADAGKRISECNEELAALRKQLEEAEEACIDAERHRQKVEDELVELKTAGYNRDALKKQIKDLRDEKTKVVQELNAMKMSAEATKTTIENNAALHQKQLQQQLKQQQQSQQQSQLPLSQQYSQQNDLAQQQKSENILKAIEKSKEIATENEKLKQELSQEKAAHEKYLVLYKNANEHAKRLEEELMGNNVSEHTQSSSSQTATSTENIASGRNNREESDDFYATHDDEEIRNKEEIAKLHESVKKYKEEAETLRAKVNEFETLYKGVPTAVAYEEEQKRLFMLDVTLDSNNVIRSEKNKAVADLKKLTEEHAALKEEFNALSAENNKKTTRIGSLEEQLRRLTELNYSVGGSIKAELDDVIRRRDEVFDRVRTKLSAQDLIYVGIPVIPSQGRSAATNNGIQPQPQPPSLQSQPSQQQQQQQQQNLGMKRGRDEQHSFHQQQKIKQMQPKQKQNKLFK